MKRITYLLMLFTSIAGNLCAQTNVNRDKTFEVPDNIIFNRKFYVSLENGNKMQIEVVDIADLDRIANIDSMLQIYLKDVAPLSDSFANPLYTRRIDYVTDTKGRVKIRLSQFPPEGTSFLVSNGELASLRTAQDTINIIGILQNPPKPKQKISLINPHYYRIVFYLNDMKELSTYMKGILQEKIKTIQNHVNEKWPLILGTSSHYLKKDRTISGDKPKGFTASGTGDYITGFITLNAQNYKNYFVPSFSLGIKLTLANRDRAYKWEPGFLWEPHYFFAKDNKNKLRTYRNDFLTLNYAQGGTRDHDARKDFSFHTAFSLGYLIHRSGDFMEKNTFRLGAGKIQLYKTAIEPSIYFNNFFKGVSPGIRVIQSF